MIPPVRTWKVTVVETGEVLFIDTINRSFARALAMARGHYGQTFKVSLDKIPAIKKKQHTCVAGGAPCAACFEGKTLRKV